MNIFYVEFSFNTVTVPVCFYVYLGSAGPSQGAGIWGFQVPGELLWESEKVLFSSFRDVLQLPTNFFVSILGMQKNFITTLFIMETCHSVAFVHTVHIKSEGWLETPAEMGPFQLNLPP